MSPISGITRKSSCLTILISCPINFGNPISLSQHRGQKRVGKVIVPRRSVRSKWGGAWHSACTQQVLNKCSLLLVSWYLLFRVQLGWDSICPRAIWPRRCSSGCPIRLQVCHSEVLPHLSLEAVWGFNISYTSEEKSVQFLESSQSYRAPEELACVSPCCYPSPQSNLISSQQPVYPLSSKYTLNTPYLKCSR